MAVITDKITDAFNSVNPNSARVLSARATGITSLVCDNLAGWPTVTPVHFATYKIDTNSKKIAGSQTDWKGIVSGSTIGSLTFQAGAADSGNAIGDIVEMMPTSSWAHDLYTALTNQHKQTDGSHKNLTTDTLAVSGVATFTGIPLLPDNTVEPRDLVAGTGSSWAWQSYTPTVGLGGGGSHGNAVITGAYVQIGKTVHYWINYNLGSTTNWAPLTSMTFTLPVAASAAYAANSGSTYGTGFGNIAGQTYELATQIGNATTALLVCKQVNSTFLFFANITTAQPATWLISSNWSITGTYEAA